ncbi:acyl-CoA dehydrogenase family protein [Antrihabitans sp. YC2-6]|uniref:acyl-CoA dehydrogenase family protein n=1 Tax=Antrihabitans sp. YC2-6 TaxID=2799498 RepID=UPI0018F4395B|nr:acyl-CoA dehydrogenase family protein [Antrihabitans sp. YC2-6]MBJ8345847.1 acyl-CoA/acyl-ACP dehydrogenase [Antrihabitans sp. YC2-6]
MDFTPTEAQQDLEQLTRDIATKLVTPERQRELDAAAERLDEPLWHALSDAGVLAAALPDAVGGGGFGVLEQCTILRELGRTLGAVPYLPSVVLAAGALAEFGTPAQQEFAQRAASGEILTVALAEENNDEPARPVTAVAQHDSGWALTGAKIAVPVANRAVRMLVPAATPDGVAVFLVDPKAAGVTVVAQQVVDNSVECLVGFDEVQLSADDLLGSLETGADVVSWLLTRAALGLAASQLGTLERALELVSDYARERVQFERPIGSFQAVAQRLADAYIDVKGVRLTVLQAAWQLSEGLPAAAEVRAAKFWAADAGHRVAHTLVHVHGGVGLDTDHIAHRYFLAAKHNEFALGSATDQLRHLGAILAVSA